MANSHRKEGAIVEPLTRITEVKALQPVLQRGDQQQRPPLTQGQLVQGIISAKNGANLFTLNFDGVQMQTESTVPLQVGQKLDLQVAALTPRIELQIVSNPVNRLIGNAIHLIGQQQTTFSDLTVLAEQSERLPQLSSNTRETLQFYAQNLNTSFQGGPTTPPETELVTQLLKQTAEILAMPPQSPDSALLSSKIGTLLQQLARHPSLTPETAQRATNLAAAFNQSAGSQPSTTSALPEAMTTTALLPEADNTRMLQQIGTLLKNEPNANTLLKQLLPLLQENNTLPAAQPFRQLLTLLAGLDSELLPRETSQLDGGQLEKIITRLGTNTEQLLAQGTREEVVQTLKFSLLELSQQLSQADKSTVQADKIVQSIELYQFLQIRLASESLFFMPLPYPFLDQGYLLVDADRPDQDAEDTNDTPAKSATTYTLHLQLQGLGNLEIKILQKNDQIAVQFLAEDVERAKFMAGYREELKHWLTTADLESVQYLVGSIDPVKALLEKIMQGGVTGMVDTNA
jgi:hypothetical protein